MPPFPTRQRDERTGDGIKTSYYWRLHRENGELKCKKIKLNLISRCTCDEINGSVHYESVFVVALRRHRNIGRTTGFSGKTKCSQIIVYKVFVSRHSDSCARRVRPLNSITRSAIIVGTEKPKTVETEQTISEVCLFWCSVYS